MNGVRTAVPARTATRAHTLTHRHKQTHTLIYAYHIYTYIYIDVVLHVCLCLNMYQYVYIHVFICASMQRHCTRSTICIRYISKVTSLPNLLHILTVELTFEKFHQRQTCPETNSQKAAHC